eukprot:12246877-Prorocentrum_lima.AAC.1
MTSSLVGSEMCIRDRVSGSHQAQTKSDVRIGADLRMGQDEKLESIFTWPVSYTHLTLPTICSV